MKVQPLKVLLVEDNPGDARLVREMLSYAAPARFQVTQTAQLAQALELLGQETFDVLLLDLMLQDTPRLGALLEIYDKASEVPTVVLTGLEDETVALWVLKEGAQDYLVKGKVDAYTLVHSIEYAMERHRERIGFLA